MVVKAVEGNAKGGAHEIAEKRYVQRRELEVLAMYANGITIEEAAKKMGVSPHTIKNHLFNIGKKLRSKSRANAVIKAMDRGMLEVVQLDREEAFGEERKSDYLWCLHCERTYKYGKFREVKVKPFVVNHVRYEPTFQMCPYKDCDGDTVLDAKQWSDIREYHPEYPEIPEPDKVYPLY